MAFALAGCSDPDPAPQAYAWEVSDSALEDRAWDIAGMLPVEPGSYVPPVSDRSAWEAYGRQSPQLLAKAKTFLNQPVPALPDDLYLTFTTKGTRKGYERPYSARIERLGTFAAAEAVANNGQFITAIERELQAILDEKTWVMPAHDRDLKNFNGEVVDVDLGASRRGLAVAGVLTLLGDKLSTELTEQAHAELKRRVFEPYLKRLTGQDDSLCRWVKWDNNWNAVCHSGVVAAALFTLPSEDTRGLIVAGAEASLPRYFKSFRSDGFCTEGLSYWNYGFGHYVTLAETFWRLSEGEIDLYESPLVRKIATYPARLEMAPRQFPSFGDSPRNPQPEAWILDVCASHLPLSGDVKQEPYPAIPLFLEQCFRVSFSPSRPLSLAAMREDQLRSWFPEAQVYVGRMPGDSSEQMAIAVKGGRNGENHGHNDLGQFIIANRGRQVITDPGGEAYTAATFGPKRYESPMLNSIGHPVPVIAGQLQGSERTAKTEVVSTDFTDGEDRVVFDLKGAYAVSTLEKLEREYVYTRQGAGELQVVDTVAFSKPEAFASSLITYGSVEQMSPNELLITDGDARLHVKIDSGDAPFSVEQELVRPKGPLRVLISLDDPVAKATMSYHFSVGPEIAPQHANEE